MSSRLIIIQLFTILTCYLVILSILKLVEAETGLFTRWWLTTVRTITVHRQVLPAGHQKPQWMSRQCPRLGCPFPPTQQCQSPFLDPENKKKTSCEVLSWDAICVDPHSVSIHCGSIRWDGSQSWHHTRVAALQFCTSLFWSCMIYMNLM